MTTSSSTRRLQRASRRRSAWTSRFTVAEAGRHGDRERRVPHHQHQAGSHGRALSSRSARARPLRARGVPVWHGGMLESGIGRAHNLHLSTLAEFPAAWRRRGQPAILRAEDLIEPPIEVSADGTVTVPADGPGIGVAVDGTTASRERRCGTRRFRPREHPPSRRRSCWPCCWRRRPRPPSPGRRRPSPARATSRSWRGSCASKINGCCATRCSSPWPCQSLRARKRRRRRRRRLTRRRRSRPTSSRC